MKKVILDTNVVISGIFFSGPPSKILEEWAKKRFQLITNNEILDEYREVANELSQKFKKINQEKMIELISLNSKVFFSIDLKEVVTEDPKDEKFIACAIASKTKIIVSGDKHLLKVSGYKGIQILKPRHFLDEFLT